MRWLLGGSVCLTLLSLLLPANDEQSPLVEPRGVSLASPEAGAGLNVPPTSVTAALTLPAELPRQTLEAAEADLFLGVQPPPPKLTPVQAAVPAPAAPQTPMLNYRFLGRFVAPNGEPMVYLSRHGDNKEFAITAGTQLDEGFVVEAIKAETVVLRYPPAGTRLNLAIPSAESQPAP
ncbi:hypothetical protein [Roseateles aquae]|nr:hypothetical protein [Paucibacter sp. APW11]